MTPDAGSSWVVDQFIALAVRREAEEDAQRLAADAQFRSARKLAADVAPILRRTSAEVFEALTYLPDNLLSLLLSPEGWSALAHYVAADLGSPCLNYRPTVH